jgi:hypothetical protein
MKFQSDLLNQKFLLFINCKFAKEVLQKDVQNIASKQIFTQWKVILSIFYFGIEYIKGDTNFIPNFLTRKFLQNRSRCLPNPNLETKEVKTHKQSPSLQNVKTL